MLRRQKAETKDDLTPDAPEASAGMRGGEPACCRGRSRRLCGARLLRGGAGVLNNDQGGPLHPPGLRMAEALHEVQDRSNGTWTRKRGFAEEQLGRLSECIRAGLDEVKEQQEVIRGYVAVIAEVAATLEPGSEDITEREEQFEALIDRFEATEDPIRHGMATVMLSFLAGLFVGEEEYEAIRDNLDLERWFRLPKSHERRIHGHRHAGSSAGPGRADVGACPGCSHGASPGPFTVDALLAYRTAREPPCQTEARNRRTIMRKARSQKQRPLLLAELERRYRETPEF